MSAAKVFSAAPDRLEEFADILMPFMAGPVPPVKPQIRLC